MADPAYFTIHRLNRDEIRRLFSKFIVDGETGCWNWLPQPSRKYGRLKFRGKEEASHRVLYAWLVEPLPRGFGVDVPQLDHVVCDNTRCCNPSHVKLVTLAANVLRSNNPAAQNARRTHCVNGHPLPDKRTPLSSGRECAICKQAAHRSPSFVRWNKDFGRRRYQERMNGPDGDALRAKRKAYMSEWQKLNREHVNAKAREHRAKQRARRDVHTVTIHDGDRSPDVTCIGAPNAASTAARTPDN